MGFEHELIVRHSDLYEGKGLAKPLLRTIAWLMEGPAKDGEDPNPNEGWCTAGEDYLAAANGMSVSQVSKLVNVFEADGHLIIKRVRMDNGKVRNFYAFKNLDAIKDRAMLKSEGGTFIRAANPNKRRNNSHLNFRLSQPLGAASEQRSERGPDVARSGVRVPLGAAEERVLREQQENAIKSKRSDSAATYLSFPQNSKQDQTSGTPSPNPSRGLLVPETPRGDEIDLPVASLRPPSSVVPRSAFHKLNGRPPSPEEFLALTSEERQRWLDGHHPKDEHDAVRLRYMFERLTRKPSHACDFQQLIAKNTDDLEVDPNGFVRYVGDVMSWAIKESHFWEFHNSKHFCSDKVWSSVSAQHDKAREPKTGKKAATKEAPPQVPIEQVTEELDEL